ncbi:MAG TPA: efflux RND transporter periplasmic adaptor subunit [Dinghuibacter sp.]|uniref:efflux RND transporter periplasmic adaptor subunit n=1 Tax=Dinghuibacter sp. TaxID=2024697 RepID=UPI002C34AB5A|nr:efflux RND transporter periplasmic adaptor subunit [Dinghuibacter sp.]HTJ12045.1 efflux RND transporter periplasmic adaptor subunit [Dinghuibacter sp.]
MNRVVLGGCFLTIALFGCNSGKPPATDNVIPVNLMTVNERGVLYYDRLPATMAALSSVDLRAQVQGYVTGIYFTEGQHVTKGQKLYEIDERLYQAQVDQAQANLKVAQGNQVQAQQDADRYDYLNKYNAVAKQTLDHAVIALQNAKNETAAAEQQVKTAETNLTYSVIRAPFDGTIGFSQVKLGNTVSVGTTVLNTVSSDDPMGVDFFIPESQLSHYLELKNHAQKDIDSLFTVILPDHSIYPHVGHISIIDRAVDPQTGTIHIRVDFPNPKFELRAGMSGVVRVHNQELTPKMVVPAKAVVEQMGEYFLYVAKDTVYHAAGQDTTKAKSDTARLRAIQVKVILGQTIGPNVIVESGIKEGDKIIVDGVQSVHDGSPVTTANKANPAAAGGRGR